MTVSRISYFTCDVCGKKIKPISTKLPPGWMKIIRKRKVRHICFECLNEIGRERKLQIEQVNASASLKVK